MGIYEKDFKTLTSAQIKYVVSVEVKNQHDMVLFHQSEPTYILALCCIVVGLYDLIIGRKKPPKRGGREPNLIISSNDLIDVQRARRRNGTEDQ